MQVRHTLLLIFLLFVSLHSGYSQQIQKGLSSIGGSVEVNHSTHTNYEYSQIAIAPSYGQFINDHVFVGGQAQFFRNSLYGYGRSVYQSYAAYGQYYFNPKSKWVVFSSLSLNARLSVGDDKFNAQSLGLSVGVGVHRFLNQELALRGDLTYSFGRVIYPYKDLYQNLYARNNESPLPTKLKIGISSFINFGDTRSFTKSYVGKKRQIVNLSCAFYEDFTNLQLNYGYFVSDNLLVGASLEGGIDLAPSIYVEYLQPLHKKLFAHVKVKNSIYGGNNTPGFTYGLDVGLDYFLTPYTMIEANLFSYQHRYINEDPNFSYYHPNLFSYGPQVGLRYFLR